MPIMIFPTSDVSIVIGWALIIHDWFIDGKYLGKHDAILFWEASL